MARKPAPIKFARDEVDHAAAHAAYVEKTDLTGAPRPKNKPAKAKRPAPPPKPVDTRTDLQRQLDIQVDPAVREYLELVGPGLKTLMQSVERKAATAHANQLRAVEEGRVRQAFPLITNHQREWRPVGELPTVATRVSVQAAVAQYLVAAGYHLTNPVTNNGTHVFVYWTTAPQPAAPAETPAATTTTPENVDAAA